MNICRIVYDWPPPWDGLAPHPYEITAAQAKNGHHIHLFTGRWPKSGDLVKIENTTIDTVIREPFPGTIVFTSCVILFIKYILWRRNNTPDILHTHGHFAFWIYVYRNFLLRFFPWSPELKIPLVVHFHRTAKGRWSKMESENKNIMPHSKYVQWPLEVYSDKVSCKIAAACVFVSQALKEEAVKFYEVSENKCFVVESGVNTELFKPIGAEEKEKSLKDLGLDRFDKVLLNVGMMVERKNIHLIVQALKFLPEEYKLVLVGTGNKSYLARISEEITRNKLEERVVRVSYTPYPMVPIAYQVADLFVLPSSWEGLPKVMMEAMGCGVPVLASGFKLSTEIRGLFYLENTDPQNMATKIKEIVESKPAVDIYAIQSQHSWHQRVSVLESVYDYAKKHFI